MSLPSPCRRPVRSPAWFTAISLAVFLWPGPNGSAFAGAPPPEWQVTGFGRGGVLTAETDATVDYDAGTWNVKTGRSQSALVVQSYNGDISAVMKITSASGQPNARIGIMMWSSLALTAGKAGLVMDPQAQRIYFTWDESSQRAQLYSNFVQVEGIGFPVWLRLTRAGSYFVAEYSQDGQEWRPVGAPVNTFWPGLRPEVFAGIYGNGVCEQRITDFAIQPATRTVPDPLPEGWTLDVRGQPNFAGGARFAAGQWTLTGMAVRGRGGYHNVVASKPVPAGVQLTTRIRIADLADPQVAGGLQLSAHGVDTGIIVYPAAGRLTFFKRNNADGRLLLNTSLPLPASMVGKAETFLRLAVLEGRVAAFHGPDTNDWTQVGEVITVNELAADVTGGLELVSASASRSPVSVRFDEFEERSITALPLRAAPVAPAPVVAAAPTNNLVPRTAVPAPRPAPLEPVRPSAGATIVGTLLFLGFIGLVVLGVAALILIKPFNRLVYLRNRALKGWSQIDVQLKRRHDLILNFMETVKGYAKHERDTIEGVARARSAAVNASSVEDCARAEAALNASMRSLYAVVESYPELKASQNFNALQHNLTDTENKLATSREGYNEEVLTYNTAVQSFPTNLIAFLFRFKERAFFEVKGEAEREVPAARL